MCLMKCIVYWFVRVFRVCSVVYEVNMQAVSALSNTSLLLLLPLSSVSLITHMMFTVGQLWMSNFSVCISAWLQYLAILFTLHPLLCYEKKNRSLLFPVIYCRCLHVFIRETIYVTVIFPSNTDSPGETGGVKFVAVSSTNFSRYY